MEKSAFSKLSNFITENSKELLQFLKSTSFSKAVSIGIGVSVPIILGIIFNQSEIGLAICFGAFWSSPSDVSGSFSHKKNGILFSAAIIMIVSFIGGYLQYETWFALPILGLLAFCIAIISVFGFRASLISFSGLLALVLSFARDYDDLAVYQFSLLIGVGGLWYLLLAKIRQLISPKAEIEELLTKTFLRTADFLETRGKLVGPHEDRGTLQSKLYSLQSDLTEQHATLREMLILSRKSSGQSRYKDKRLLVFAQLVDLLETAIANPVNYEKMDALLVKNPEFTIGFQDLIFEMAAQLRMIAKAGGAPKKLPKNDVLSACFEKLKEEVSAFGKTNEVHNYEGFFMLQNLLGYQEKQFEKLKEIQFLLGDSEINASSFISREVSNRFLVRQNYNPKLLLRNLSFRSTIFRHSLRLAVTLMIGYAIGNLFPLQNPYWILLTIIVIMRPSYGLTKTRSKDRIIGTLLGGAIAVGMVFLIRNPYVYAALGIVSLVVAISMVQKNYKASATFITLSVIFIYAIIQPDVLTVIKFRVIDTVLGAALSYVAMLWLWPTWEFVEIKESIEKSVAANKNFLQKITEYYQQKGKLPTSYKIARKEAFLQTSNLSSSFQRMAQEPKSKQKETEKIYELVVLNHEFLSSLASFSAYIQHHKTTEASEKFKIVADKLDKNLEKVLQCLKDEKCSKVHELANNDFNFEKQFPEFYAQQNNKWATHHNEESIRNLQEMHLVGEQLKWLFSISCKMLKIAATLDLD